MKPTDIWRTTTFVIAVLCSSPSLSAVGEITIEDEVIPASFFPAYEERYVASNERCSPTSDAYVRDGVIHLWLSVADGREKGWELEGYTTEAISKLQEEIDRQGADVSLSYKSDRQLRMLQRESHSYNRHRSANISEEAAISLYEQRVASKDPNLVDVPVVRFRKVQFDKRYDEMQAFVDALEAGESWETLMAPLDGFARNNDKSDQWHTIPDMDDYSNTTIQRLVGDGRQLRAGDVIGPIEMYAYAQIFRIEESKVLPVVQLHEALNGEESWGLESSTDILRQRHFKKVRAELRAGRDIREDGEIVVVPDRYPTCDAE